MIDHTSPAVHPESPVAMAILTVDIVVLEQVAHLGSPVAMVFPSVAQTAVAHLQILAARGDRTRSPVVMGGVGTMAADQTHNSTPDYFQEKEETIADLPRRLHLLMVTHNWHRCVGLLEALRSVDRIGEGPVP